MFQSKIFLIFYFSYKLNRPNYVYSTLKGIFAEPVGIKIKIIATLDVKVVFKFIQNTLTFLHYISELCDFLNFFQF